MTKIQSKARKSEKGFTLVELAIVMIIIGLLIGGVLKGQELINNAQIAAVVTEVKGFDTAINTFRDSFAGYPGDLRTPDTRIQGCGAIGIGCDGTGNGDGRIGPDAVLGVTAVSAAANNGGAGENKAAWSQMEAAAVISAVDSADNTLTYGTGLPQSAFGNGGYRISYHGGGAINAGAVGAAGHYLQLGLSPTLAINAANSEFMTASQAARIDRKMDNGVPGTGSIREVGAAGTCQAGGVYDEATNLATCALVIGLSN